MMRPDRAERGTELAFGERTLLLLLLAATAMPLWPISIGEPITAPFGLSNGAVATGVALAALAWSGWRIRADGARAAPPVVATLAGAAALSLLFAAIVRWRANGFFTAVALRDGMTALLALHLVGIVLRRSARRRGRRVRRPGDATAAWSRATRLADDLTTAVAALVVSFWMLAAVALHIVAGPVLLLGVATSLLVVVLRVPDALPEPPRRRPPRHGGDGGVRAA